MEAGDSGITLELMIKALLKLGVSKQEIVKLLEGDLEPIWKTNNQIYHRGTKISVFLSASVASQRTTIPLLLHPIKLPISLL